jgi:hypothetical protein
MNTTISQLLTIRQETADALATMPSWVASDVTESYYRTVAWCNRELAARGIDPQADYDVIPTEEVSWHYRNLAISSDWLKN